MNNEKVSERQKKILDYIIENKKVDVSELSEVFKVSEVTIRKDLDRLEEGQIIKREHGYAVLNDSDDINVRMATNYNSKQNIAKRGAELVNDNETIFIESGSCCALLAKEIAEKKDNITIITNCTFIANFLRDNNNVHIYLSGGEYQKESGVLIGPMALDIFRQFYVDKCFIGVDGYLPGIGFFGNDLSRGHVVQEMINHAKTTYVVTDSSKLGRSSLNIIANPGKNIKLITDDKIDDLIRSSLNKDNIEIV